jgi:hypothetical protein
VTAELETDYLIIGTGCVGMAFADTLVDECDADVVMIDGHGAPGGHWNDAYPFVTLHQPSSFYGVASTPLGRDRIDERGFNAGLGELAGGPEVQQYFHGVMRDHLLPTGRVRYFPKCWWDGEGAFTSQVTGETTRITARRRIVDTTHLKTTVPSTHTPSFEIDEGVRFMPLNDLPKVSAPPAGWVIVGGGKTAMDACLWLLENGVDPERITWIMSRDGWFIPRETTQPRIECFEATFSAQAAQFEACAAATDVDDLFARLEAGGVLVRLDASVEPEMFHAPTVSRPELEAMRSIRNVVRLGRVTRIGADEIELTGGTIPTSPDHVHVDCSASAIPKQAPKTIFDGHLLTPQTVRAYQPAFSASVLAWIEAHYDDDEKKNALATVVPIPDGRLDWLKLTVANAINMRAWSEEPELMAFLTENRLNGFGQMASLLDPNDAGKMALLTRMRESMVPGVMNLVKLIGEAEA